MDAAKRGFKRTFRVIIDYPQQFPESEEGEGGIMAGASNLDEVACSAAKRPRRFRMAEYEVTKMEGVDEDPEISFKVSQCSRLLSRLR